VRGRLERIGDRCEIGRLMVVPNLASRGIDRQLLEFAESQVPEDVRHLDLYATSTSTPGRAANAIFGAPDGDRQARDRTAERTRSIARARSC
jgi:GNAT superfamily N-acetyltransferase